MLKRKTWLHLNDGELEALLRKRYVADGLSTLALATEMNVSRDTVNRWLSHFKVPLRSQSEANRVSAAKASPTERKRRAAAAHAAVRGSNRLYTSELLRAETVSHKAKMSKWEKQFALWLVENDLPNFLFAYPVDIFNVDFAFVAQKIAVEIDGGNWHTTDRKQAQDDKKTEFLEDNGWCVLRVATHGWKNKDTEYTRSFERRAKVTIGTIKELL